MFARVLEMKTKQGQARALCSVIEEKVLPIIKKYTGFVDGVSLIPEETPNSVLTISFWQNKEAAEKYRMEAYNQVAAIYLPFLEGGIQVRGCDVPFAMTYKVHAAKAS